MEVKDRAHTHRRMSDGSGLFTTMLFLREEAKSLGHCRVEQLGGYKHILPHYPTILSSSRPTVSPALPPSLPSDPYIVVSHDPVNRGKVRFGHDILRAGTREAAALLHVHFGLEFLHHWLAWGWVVVVDEVA